MDVISASPLANPEVLPLRSVEAIACTSALVVAPHPDDETLGCGGAIALLRARGCNVQVLVISDGTLSHPRSCKYPAPKLRALRESETVSALAVLGVNAVTFLRLPDGAVPTQEPDFSKAAASCCNYLTQFPPQVVFLPVRYDPHPDHRASWKLIYTALANLTLSSRIIEYPIWDWDKAQRGTLLNFTSWRLDISTVVKLKQQAIAFYRSQTTNLIDDDPEGFCLTPEMLANFTRPWEVYLEARQ